MRLLYLLALGCALGRPTTAAAQLANGNFETQLRAPEGRNNIALTNQPSTYNDLANWYSLRSGDYMATNATDPQVNPQGTPYYGPFAPNSSQGCVALTREPGTRAHDQFITQQVNVVAGHTYRAGFATLRRPGGQFAEKIALTVTTSMPSLDSQSQLSPAPYATIVSGPVSGYQNWTNVFGTFVAQSSTAWITVGYDSSLANYDPSLYSVTPGFGSDYYAIDDVVLVDSCQSAAASPYLNGTYRVNNGPSTTLQSTNFLQRNMNALNVVVTLNQPYNFTFTSRDPNVPLSSSARTTSFTIPASSNNDVRIYAVATSGPAPCGMSGDVIFSPVGYRAPNSVSYAASPNPASSELTVSDGSPDAAAPTAEPFTAELYDARGKKMKLKKSTRGKAVLDTHDLPDGLYYLRVGTGKNAHSEQLQITH